MKKSLSKLAVVLGIVIQAMTMAQGFAMEQTSTLSKIEEENSQENFPFDDSGRPPVTRIDPSVLEALGELVRDPNSFIRPCPFCHAPTEKSAGCNAMLCPLCKNEWHWIKGRARIAGRFSIPHDFSPDQARMYKIPGDEDYLPGMECAFTAEAEKNKDKIKIMNDASEQGASQFFEGLEDSLSP